MQFENGQIVMFTEFLEEGDEEVRFVVIEDREDRVLVEEICDLELPPQRSLPKADLELAPDQTIRQKPKSPLL